MMKTMHFLCLPLDTSLNISILLTLLADRARSMVILQLTCYTNYLLTFLQLLTTHCSQSSHYSKQSTIMKVCCKPVNGSDLKPVDDCVSETLQQLVY